MHRLPLELEKSPLEWDRSLPEYEMFKKSQEFGSLHNTEVFLDMIKFRINQFDSDYFRDENLLTLTAAKILAQFDDFDSQYNFFYEINVLIFRAPTNTPAFTGALLSRGYFFLKKCCYLFAANDFKLYIELEPKERMIPINLFRVHGLLSFCYYSIGKYEQSKKHFAEHQHYKEILSDELKDEQYLDGVTLFVLKHVPKIEREINLFNDIKYVNVKEKKFLPFGGFNKESDDVSTCSASCYYVSEEDNNEPKKRKGLYASSKIPHGECVLVDKPTLFSFSTPFAHCAYCLKHQEQMYTCFKCRYKTYCSMDCMKLDKEEHDDECLGYKYLVLIMFDGTLLIRLFMRLIKYLNKFVTKSNKKIRKLNTYKKVWDYLIESSKNDLQNSGPYMKYFIKKPNYAELPDTSFLTLITYTLRLSVYVQNLTKAKEIFFNKLSLDPPQTFILMGTMLLRLHGHIYLNSKDFDFREDYQPIPSTIPMAMQNFYVGKKINNEDDKKKKGKAKKNQKDADDENDFDLTGNENQQLLEYFNFNKPKEYAKIFNRIQTNAKTLSTSSPRSEHTKPCPSPSNAIINYMDNVIVYSFGGFHKSIFLNDMPYTANYTKHLSLKLMAMDAETFKRFFDCYIVNFKYFITRVFLQTRQYMDAIHQTVTVISPILKKFNHSCIPNVKIIRLSNGTVLGKTLRAIKPNEELTISYNADYMVNDRTNRKAHLESLGLTCQDSCCTSDEKDEPTNLRWSIFCNNHHDKKVALTQAEITCSQCNQSFNTLLQILTMYLDGFESEIYSMEQTNASIRDFAILYSCYYNFLYDRLVEGNEQRIEGELKMAKFLAENNFLNQSIQMVFAVGSSLKNYSEEALWSIIYEDMMDVINIIFYRLIQNGFNTTIDKSVLNKLLTLGFVIIQCQERFYKCNHYDDVELVKLYDNMIRLYEVKELINVIIMMPYKLKKLYLNF